LEMEITALSQVLDSHGVNMNTSLTTFDGFPRADIDVPQIRMTRARIIHLKNDYKTILAKLETAIEEQFAQLEANRNAELEPVVPPAPLSIPNRSATGPMSPVVVPFAKVDEVISNSPAEAAHLQVGDQIIRFGTVNASNHERLTRLGEVVGQNEGRELVVLVQRENQQVQLRLVPRRDWGGRGLLGCHLVPL